MTKLIFGLTLAALSSTALASEVPVSISCAGKGEFAELTLSGKVAVTSSTQGTIMDARMTAKEIDSSYVEEGSSDLLTARTQSYGHYEEYARFDMNRLIDSVDQGEFTPVDWCNILIFVPTHIQSVSKARVPAILDCHYVSGTLTMSCDVKKD